MKDNFLNYCWLVAARAATAETAANECALWMRTLATPEVWVSDQGPHSKCEVIRKIAIAHAVRHHTTLAYSTWSNETIESLMTPVLVALRALTLELKLAPTYWESVLPMVVTALN